VVDGPSTFWDRWQADAVEENNSEGPSMREVVTIGLDLAKTVFQVRGIAVNGKILIRRQLRRGEVLKFFQSVPPCLVGMEACGMAHYWAREIAAFGHTVRLMPPAYVKPYV
jgi:transposase